jgi:hypothetical protein
MLTGIQEAANELLVILPRYHTATGRERAELAEAYATKGLWMRTLASRSSDERTRVLTQAALDASSLDTGREGMAKAADAVVALVDHVGPLIRATFREGAVAG